MDTCRHTQIVFLDFNPEIRKKKKNPNEKNRSSHIDLPGNCGIASIWFSGGPADN
jgi:hypothetical protein